MESIQQRRIHRQPPERDRWYHGSGRLWAVLVVAVLVAGSMTGCKKPRSESLAGDSTLPELEKQYDRSLPQTVGSACELVGYQAIRVHGYGMVYGLPGTGSSQCPPTQREFILQYLRRLKDKGLLSREYEFFTAEQILESNTTAVVSVAAVVPAGAPKGETFDVEVSTVQQSQVTSLQGGWLMPTELRVVVPSEQGGVLAGASVVIASGPVFINPFSLSQKQDVRTDPRRAYVVGGGRSINDRNISLALLQPDFRMAQLIERQINTRFVEPGGKKVADATRSMIRISIPVDYRDRYHHFVKLLLALELDDRPAYQDLRLRELDQQFRGDDPDYQSIALAWEAIGKDALQWIKPFYEDPSAERAFYAARTALALDDFSALNPLIRIATDADHPYQLRATGLLASVADQPRTYRLRAVLAELLDAPSALVRLAAYHGLRKAGDPRIRSHSFPIGFELDVVPSQGKNLICVWVAEKPRLVLIGNAIARDNIFYETPDDTVLINANPGESIFRIVRRDPYGHEHVTARCPLRVADFVTTLASPFIAGDDGGADPADQAGRSSRGRGRAPYSARTPRSPNARVLPGLTFSEIVGILYQLCHEQDAIPASFTLNRDIRDLTGF